MSLNNVSACQVRLRRLCGIIFANNVYHVAVKRLTSSNCIGGRATSVLELFLLRLDEQGLNISSPWGISGKDSIVGTLWPKLYATWLRKEQWAGCREVIEDVLVAWEQAQVCLAACAGLGNAEPAIRSISQFRGTQTQWLHIDVLASGHCHLTPLEHATITSWLSMTGSQQLEASAET
jgi:hypothetical protein